MKTIVLALAALMPAVAGAQMFKCTDAAGKISYTNRTCSELGLKEVGEVQERINVSPAYRPPPGSSSRPAPAAQAPAQPPKPPAAEEDGRDPNRRCFSVAAGKGKTITRCNEKPDEDAATESPR